MSFKLKGKGGSSVTITPSATMLGDEDFIMDELGIIPFGAEDVDLDGYGVDGTSNGSNQKYILKLPDGTMIQGGTYYRYDSGASIPATNRTQNFHESFTGIPNVSMCRGNGIYCYVSDKATSSNFPMYHSSHTEIYCYWWAVGRWK